MEGQSREVSGPELRSVGGATGSLEEDCTYSYCAELEKAIVGRTTALTGAQWEGRQLVVRGDLGDGILSVRGLTGQGSG